MKKMKYFLAAAGFCVSLTLSAQSRNAFEVQVGGGLSTMSYTLTQGTRSNGYGGQLSLSYAHFFTPTVGFSLGAGFSMLNSSTTLNEVTATRTGLHDDSGDEFELRTTLMNYKERQNVQMITIPVMLRIEPSVFYIGAGVKVGVPLKGTYSVSGATLRNSAHYPKYSVIANSPDFAGFGDFTLPEVEGSLPLKTSIMASLELGAKIAVGKQSLIYIGVYADYGVTPLVKSSQAQALLNYAFPSGTDNATFSTNSVLTSDLSDGQPFVKQAVPLSGGLTVRYSFGKNKSSEVSRTTSSPVKSSSRRRAERSATFNPTDAKQRLEEAEMERKRLAAQQAAIEEEQRRQEMADLNKDVDSVKVDTVIALSPRDSDMLKLQMRVTDYSFEQTEPSESQYSLLDTKVEIMKRYPELKIELTGHTCDISRHDENVVKGQKRADAVKNYMVRHGIEADRIHTDSKAESEPIAPNDNVNNIQKNRRVEVKIVN